MTVSTIVLAPYGPGLWQDALPAGYVHILLPPSVEPDWSRMASSVLAMAPPTFAVIGFCSGGVLAFELVRQAASRVQGIALINATAAADTPLAARIRSERIAKLNARLAGQTLPDDAYLDHAVPWLLGRAARLRPAAVTRTRSLLAEIPLGTSLAQQRAMATRCDARALLTAFSGPTLFLGGGEDRICNPERTREMGLLAVRGCAIVFDDCGHMLPIEDSARTRRHLAEWLRWLEGEAE